MRVSVGSAVAAAVLGALAVPIVESPAFAAGPCSVRNAAEGKSYASMQAAISAGPEDEPMTLTFTGTCNERVFFIRKMPTTIIGRKTRTSGPPTLDASSVPGFPALMAVAAPVTLKGFTVTGGTPVGTDVEIGGGGLNFEDTDVTLVDMVIRGNNASAGNGGGISMEVGLALPDLPPNPIATLVVSGKTVIENNTAFEDGGGIYAGEGVQVRIEGTAKVRNNKAFGSGGGIWMRGTTAKGAQLDIVGKAAITGNIAVGSAGGVSIDDDMIATVASKARVDGNESIGAAGGGIVVGLKAHLKVSGSVSNNEAFANGGGIASISDVELTKGARINGNTADSGGGLYLIGGSFVALGASIRSNIAEQNGGGVFAELAANMSVVGSSISGNRAKSGGGGGIWMQGTSMADIKSTHVDRNAAMPATGPGLFGTNVGGGIVVKESVLMLGLGTTVANNKTYRRGGGIAANETSIVALQSGTSITGNTVAVGEGGGIWADDVQLDVTGKVSISGNKAAPNSGGDGGGVFFESGGVLTMTGPGIAIRNNRAGGEGGGMLVNASNPASISGVTFSGNRSGESGGGLRLSANDPVTITDVTFTSNSSGDRDGGGAFIEGQDSVTATRLTVTNNSGLDGGGLWIGLNASSGGAMTIANSVIKLNRGRNGAGIKTEDGSLTLTSTIVEKNIASMEGGGIYFSSTVPFAMTGGAVRSNKARNGGGLYLGVFSLFGSPPSTTYTLSGTPVTKNTASFDGGGAAMGSGELVLTAGASITGNRAKRHGGGLQLYLATSYSCAEPIKGNAPDQVAGTSNFHFVPIC